MSFAKQLRAVLDDLKGRLGGIAKNIAGVIATTSEVQMMASTVLLVVES